MIRRLELITLPLRSAVLLVLVGLASFMGAGDPSEESRTDSDNTGVMARYTRDGKPWRIFYDRNHDKKWDMWIDERGGPPLLVSIDTDYDGRADQNQDETGKPLSAWRTAQIRASKTVTEFFNDPRRLQYMAIALMIYALLEFLIRTVAQ